MVEGLITLILMIADVYALYNVLTSAASTRAKIVWSLLVLFLPVLGFVAWLVAGPRGETTKT